VKVDIRWHAENGAESDFEIFEDITGFSTV